MKQHTGKENLNESSSNNMALVHKISDANSIRIDVDPKGNKVIEIEFKFIRYRMTIDNKEKAEKLKVVLDNILSEDKQEVEAPAMPKFYKKK